jgi:hypothetical protein
MIKSIALIGAAVLMALSSASIANAKSSPFDPCLVEARTYCITLHSGDRLAFYNCVLEEYEACIGSLTLKTSAGQKAYLRRCAS